MANIPLNYFKRYSVTVTNSPSAVYTAPFSRAAVLLNGYVTNTTIQDTTVTISVSGRGDAPNFVPQKPAFFFAKDLLVAGSDTTNIFPSKFVLEASDSLIISTTHPTPDAITLNLGILETLNQNA
jgi:hypothetical protein